MWIAFTVAFTISFLSAMPVPCSDCKGFSFWRRHNGCHDPQCWKSNEAAIQAGRRKFIARKRTKTSPPPPGEQADATTGVSGFLARAEDPDAAQQQRPLRPPGTPRFPGGITGHPGDATTAEEAVAAAAKASAKGQAAVAAAQAQQQGNVPTEAEAGVGQGSAGEQDADVCQGKKKMKKKKKKREEEADASKPLAGKKKMKKKKREDGVSKKKVKKKKAAQAML